MNFAEVEHSAIPVHDQMQARYPRSKETVIIHIEAGMPKRTFCCNNGMILFINEQGKAFAIPDIGVQDILKKEGYLSMHFYVPFGDGDYPIEFKKKWKKLKRQWIKYMETKLRNHY